MGKAGNKMLLSTGRPRKISNLSTAKSVNPYIMPLICLLRIRRSGVRLPQGAPVKAFKTRGYQRVSEGIRGYQRVSEGIRGYQRVSEGIRGYQRVSEGLKIKLQSLFFVGRHTGFIELKEYVIESFRRKSLYLKAVVITLFRTSIRRILWQR